jgi:hypothetical protein
MPLTWKRKYGISYLYQPSFLQQLGVFGSATEDILQAFSDEAQNHFRFAEINTHFHLPGTLSSNRSNYVLDLGREYNGIMLAYSALHQKNLNRAEGSDLQYLPSTDHAACIALSYALYHDKVPHVTKRCYQALASFTSSFPEQVICRQVKKENRVLASALCLMDKKRIYFIINNVPAEGRKMLANHWLVDRLIREYAGSGKWLDLEGSDIPGIADFYRGFGAVHESYYFCRWNKLPWPLKLLKQ